MPLRDFQRNFQNFKYKYLSFPPQGSTVGVELMKLAMILQCQPNGDVYEAC